MADSVDETGSEGIDIEQIYGYKVIAVGASPNINPSVRIEETGVETTVYKVSEYQGTIALKGGHSAYTQIDTGSTHHTGDFNILCGNAFSVETGSGGILLLTTGCTNIHSLGGITTLMATHEINLQANVISINAAEAIDIRGPINVGNSLKPGEEQGTNVLNGNLVVGNNAHVNGGMYVNGELFVPHITTVAQTMLTEDYNSSGTFINPYLNFLVFLGKSVTAKSVTSFSPLNALWQTMSALDLYGAPGMINCVLSLHLPIPGLDLITVPAKIGFPDGIAMVSDGLALLQPTMINSIISNSTNTNIKPDIANCIKPDTLGDLHNHEYVGGAISVVDSTDKLWKKAKAVESSKPAEALPSLYGGMEPKEFMEEAIKKSIVESRLVKVLKEQLMALNPFSGGGSLSPIEKS